MTIQQLTVFLAVCGELNYTRAAERVYMSRQAVRQNVAELERELSGALFENRHNRLSLTGKGRLLRDGAQSVVESYQALERTMNADLKLESPLRLGISVSLLPNYLPTLKEALAAFSESYPRLPVRQLMLENDEAAAALSAGALDACLVLDCGGRRPGLERWELTRHPAAILMRDGQPLYERDSLSPAELDGRLLYLPGLGAEFAPLFRCCEQAGARVDFQPMPRFYQVLFYVLERGDMALDRLEPRDGSAAEHTREVPLPAAPPLCSSFLTREGELSAPLRLLGEWLASHLHLDGEGQ